MRERDEKGEGKRVIGVKNETAEVATGRTQEEGTENETENECLLSREPEAVRAPL